MSIELDLNVQLLKKDVKLPSGALSESSSRKLFQWFLPDEGGVFRSADPSSIDSVVSLVLQTTQSQIPAWQMYLRDYLHVEGFAPQPASISGAIIFVMVEVNGNAQFVAWCFGQGSRWLRKGTTTPRFGLIAALNAAAKSTDSPDTGVLGASVATQDGNLRRVSLLASNPGTTANLARIDTQADSLLSVHANTKTEDLGRVVAGRSLQFSSLLNSVSDIQDLSEKVVGLSAGKDYRRANLWIDNRVPEEDPAVIDVVLERIWKVSDKTKSKDLVEISWWEPVRAADSDRPITHWRMAGERSGRNPVRRVTLTWAWVHSVITHSSPNILARAAFEREIRFFSTDDEEVGRCRLIDILSAQVSIGRVTYALVDGDVYRVDKTFLASLNSGLESCVCKSRLISYEPGESEPEYNKRAARESGMLLLDTSDIRPTGETEIEPCDLLSTDGSLFHVKRHSTATGISHLSNQAVSSATLLLREVSSRAKLKDLIQKSPWAVKDKNKVQRLVDQIQTKNWRPKVVFVIVGEWENPSIQKLSLLSRLALRTAISRLSDLGFPVEIMLIEPNKKVSPKNMPRARWDEDSRKRVEYGDDHSKR